jgi:hypothetical protein
MSGSILWREGDWTPALGIPDPQSFDVAGDYVFKIQHSRGGGFLAIALLMPGEVCVGHKICRTLESAKLWCEGELARFQGEAL